MQTDATLPRPATKPLAADVTDHRRKPQWILRSVPWLLAVAGLVGALLWTGTPAIDMARYAGYWLIGILIPGTLVYRALRGSRGNLPEDLGFGGATGLVVELVGWAIAAATGLQAYLRVWPLAVIALFALVPKLRPYWRIEDPKPLPARWSWGVAAVIGMIVLWCMGQWAALPLPPVTEFYYPDYGYHLGLIHEMTRSMPFQEPQVAGSMLRYHYLSDAHMATASMVTGIEPSTILFRLWVGPVLIVAALALAALARQLTGKWWTGPVAAAAGLLGMSLRFHGLGPLVGHPLSLLSPSHTYALPLMILLTSLLVAVLRGERFGAAWVLLAVLAVACAGAKSSVLPILVPGLGLAILAAWISGRRLPLRPLGALGVLLGGMAFGAIFFAGAGAGFLKIQFLSLERFMGQYNDAMAHEDSLVVGGWIPPELEGASAKLWIWALILFGWSLWGQIPRLAGFGLAAGRRRTDPAVWLLAGAMVAGTAASWLLYHPSGGQTYFMFMAIPLGATLTVWLLAESLPSGRTYLTVLGALALGAAIVWGIGLVYDPGHPHTIRTWTVTMGTPIAYLIGISAVLAVVWLLARRRLTALTGHGRAVIIGAILGASIIAFPLAAQGSIKAALTDPHRSNPDPTWSMTGTEIGAALWLDDHVDKNALVATNVHCRPVHTAPHCDSRAFLISGFGGHRVFIDSWAYSDVIVTQHGKDHLHYAKQPAPDQDRFDLNERVFSAPMPADVGRLRNDYGVRWLFADSRAGTVSPELARYGVIRFADGPVTIYELN